MTLISEQRKVYFAPEVQQAMVAAILLASHTWRRDQHLATALVDARKLLRFATVSDQELAFLQTVPASTQDSMTLNMDHIPNDH